MAIKDPRLCRLLPFWLDTLADSGWRIVVVLTLRPPDEVVASLHRRDPFPADSGYPLWLTYVLEAVHHSRPLPRAIVSYAELLTDWRGLAARIGGELDLAWPSRTPEVEAAIDRVLDASLRHHRSPQSSGGSAAARLAWRAHDLLTAADQEGSAPLDDLGATYRRLLEGAGPFPALVQEGNRRLAMTTQQLHETGASLKEARAVVAERDGQLQRLAAELDHAVATVQERDAQIAGLCQEHSQALAVIRERDDQLQRLASEYEYAISVIREKDDQLAGLTAEYTYAVSVVQERDTQLAAIHQRLREHPL